MYHADVAQLVERDLAKVEVAGSSPVVRSKRPLRHSVSIRQRGFQSAVEGSRNAERTRSSKMWRLSELASSTSN
jgi:hypothetical protein